jgi:hypothetical protein
MVSESAPGYLAVTTIWGGVRAGYSLTGRTERAIKPKSTTAMAETKATLGLRIKNRDIIFLLLG